MLAHTAFLRVLEADGITEAHDVRAHISREQHSSRMPQQRDLSGAVPGVESLLSVGWSCTTDYATVVLRLPGISKYLEVVRLF